MVNLATVASSEAMAVLQTIFKTRVAKLIITHFKALTTLEYCPFITSLRKAGEINDLENVQRKCTVRSEYDWEELKSI